MAEAKDDKSRREQKGQRDRRRGGTHVVERSTCVDLESRTSSYRLSQDEGLLFSDVKWSREAKKNESGQQERQRGPQIQPVADVALKSG